MENKPNKIWQWVDERLGLSEIIAFAKHKTVPVHKHSFWYYWGGVSLFLFLVQGVTGVLLLIYYRPGPEAFESVRQITYEISFGWLIRSAHSWAANLMVAAIFVHMFSVYFMKAYRAPREFGWWSGMILLLLTMIFGFSGYLLPMNELAYFATKVGLEIPTSMPVIGPAIADIVRAGAEVTSFTVQRFFALHVVILPAIFIPFLMFHLWLVQKHGNAAPPSEEIKPKNERKSIPFFPNFIIQDLAIWLIVLNILTLLAALFPWELGEPADSLKAAPKGIHPEWYFMSSFQVLKVFGKWFPGAAGESIGISIFTLGLVLWFLVPLYDPNTKSGRRGRHATYFGLFALAVLIVFTFWGYLGV
ncbi:MAG: cytochrome bc complex cytochrome b subunit [Candidatus Omnitrophica bacterium]|nr:cytochrome bc complex cytochrome b subunit [Candidatus Omnitrophota bacterium]